MNTMNTVNHHAHRHWTAAAEPPRRLLLSPKARISGLVGQPVWLNGRWLVILGLLLTTACVQSPPTPADKTDTVDDTQGKLGDPADTLGPDSATPDTAAPDTELPDTAAPDTSGDDTASPDTTGTDAGPPAPLPLAVTNPVPGPFCVGDQPDLPMPGEPCQTLGDRRCTNAGHYSSPKSAVNTYALGPDVAKGYCVRPNKVRCSDVNGKRVWVLEACVAQPAPAYCAAAKRPHSCQENQHGVSCCPLSCLSGKSKPPPGTPDTGGIGLYRALMCPNSDAGKSRCAVGTAGIYTCAVPNGTPGVKKFNGGYFTDCTASCKGCTYWFRSEVCRLKACKKFKSQEYPGQKFPGDESGKGSGPWSYPEYRFKCERQADGSPYCRKTCEEEGLFTPEGHLP